jgi:VanZ family protein
MTVQARWRRTIAGCDTVTVLWLATAAVLAVLTLVAFTAVRQYDPVPSPWPFDPGFAALADGAAARRPGGVVEGWQTEGDRSGITVENGTLRLRNDDPESGVGVRQIWRLTPGGPRAFRLMADVASEDIQGSRIGFRVGEVTVVLAGLRGTRPRAHYVEDFKFPAAAERVELAIRLRHATGILEVANLQLQALAERSSFSAVRLGLQLAWAAMLALGCWLFWRGIDHRRSALALGLAAVGGTILLLMPEGIRDGTLVRLADHLPRRLLAIEALADVGHFLIFAVAGFLMRLSRRGDPWPAQLLLLVGLAGLSELLQFMAELRTPTLHDWLTNALGAILGWLPAMAWLWWRQEGQFATQRCSSITVPPQPAKQRL